MAVCGPIQSSSVFVDTYTASEFPINSDTVLLTSLLKNRPTDGTSGSHDQCIHLRPVTPSDNYSVKVKVQPEGPAVVSVVEGVCCVNGVRCGPGDNRRTLSAGSFVELGSSYRLQYQTTPTRKPRPLRVLPPAPEQAVTSEDTDSSTEDDLSDVPTSPEVGVVKEVDMSTEVGMSRRLASGSWSVGSVECGGMDIELRARLKRIAKEVTARDHGYKDQRPPPPYEQVANSINYQLLHHSHSRVTKQLIDSLYQTLKEMELKDPDLSNIYSSFLSSYSAARGQSATPTCMIPADIPVVTFVLEMVVHICCMPDMTPLATKVCPIWMDILSILVISRPNREAIVDMGGATKLLSCMHLSVMSEEVGFQERGWAVLTSVVDSHTPPGRKPVILDASLSLVLSLVAKQLQSHPSHFPLVTALLHTLARLATVAKEAATCDLSKAEGVFPTYTPLQGTQILSSLKDSTILDHVMKVPPSLRKHPSFHDNYCLLVKALHPIKLRKRTPKETTSPITTVIKPPPKPARKRKVRRSTIGNSPSEIKEESATPPGGHTTSETSGLVHTKSFSSCRPHSYTMTVSNLIGSSDVTHPLLQSTEVKSFLGSHVTSGGDHVTSGAIHVTSSSDHVSSGGNHVTEGEASQDQETPTSTVPEHSKQVETNDSLGTPPDADSAVGKRPESDVDPQVIQSSVDVTDTVEQVETTADHNMPGSRHTEPVPVVDPLGAIPVSPTQVSPSDHGSKHSPVTTATSPVSTATSPNGQSTIPSSVSIVTSPTDQSDLFTFPQSDTLSRDVQSLLDSLRAPLPSVAVEGRGRRNSHYFRHSVKRRSRKEVDGAREVGMATEVIKEPELIEEESGPQSTGRMQWGEAPPLGLSFLPSADAVSLFEVSGEVLSPSHTLLEEVVCGHDDVISTLTERAELLEGVLSLWREEKGLQAVTNTLQGCFSEDCSDLPLFMDALNCFLQYKSPWTLAVCCVLLPALQEVVSSQQDKSCVLTVVRVLLSVVERFSDLILACKGRSRSKRLSASIDRQQQLLCYQQLHAIRVGIGNRLDLNFDPKVVTSKLRKVHSALKPFKSELADQ